MSAADFILQHRYRGLGGRSSRRRDDLDNDIDLALEEDDVFGAIGDRVAEEMSGTDPGLDFDFGEDFGEDPRPQWGESYPAAFHPAPALPAPPTIWGTQYPMDFRQDSAPGTPDPRALEGRGPAPVYDPTFAPAPPPASTSWRDLRHATHDVYRAQKKVDKFSDRLAQAKSAVPPGFGREGCDHCSERSFGGTTPSAYYGADYGSDDPVTSAIGQIESQVMNIVSHFVPTMKKPFVLPQLMGLNQRRDKVIDAGASSDSPQATAFEDQGMRLLSNLDQPTAAALWIMARTRDNLRRRLMGRPEEPARPAPVLV